MRGRSIALAAAGVFCAVSSARASLLWQFTTSTDGGGSGTLTTGPLSGGSYLITGITGTFDGQNITGLSNFNGPDDLLYPPPEFLDFTGVSFSLADGVDVELYTEGFGYVEDIDTNGGFGYGSFSASLVPEPGSLGILATCLAALGIAGRWRRKARARGADTAVA